MKFLILSISLINFSILANCKEVLIDYPSIYINGGNKNLNLIFQSDSKLLEIEVKKIFDNDILDHLESKAYDVNASFKRYWEINHKNWNFVDLNKDKKYELIFLSNVGEIENYFTEIYLYKNKNYSRIYKELGRVEAFKIHPTTNEIVLFQHQYPCCSSASHNVNMLRILGGEIKLRKKYFVAGKQNMKGEFFPRKVNYNSTIYYLNKKTSLRWSPDIITNSAWLFLPENRVCEFSKGAAYRMLLKENKWCFVLFLDPPMKSKPGTTVISPANFMETHVFGWIKI